MEEYMRLELLYVGGMLTLREAADLMRAGMKLEASYRRCDDPWFEVRLCGDDVELKGMDGWGKMYSPNIKRCFRERR